MKKLIALLLILSFAAHAQTLVQPLNGGTGKANPNANTLNLRGVTDIGGYTTTATAAGTTTLTVSSTEQQYFTGSTTQTVVLPVTSTLILGRTFRIVNNSSGSVTVNSSGSNLVATILAGNTAIITTILTSGTTAASWSVSNFGSSICTVVGTLAAGDIFYGTGSTTCGLFSQTSALILGQSGAAPTSYAGSTVTAGQIPTSISAAGALTGTATPTLGASGTVGSLTMGNATSGTVKLQPVTGALGTTTLLVPAAAGTGRASQVIAAGTSAMGTSAIASGACATVVTTTATGTVTTDTIDYAFNADLSAVTGYSGVGTLVTIYKYPTTDNVNYKVCNWTGSSITPSAATINWSVRR